MPATRRFLAVCSAGLLLPGCSSVPDEDPTAAGVPDASAGSGIELRVESAAA